MDVASLFTATVEQKAAKVLLAKYLQDYELETISDKNILKQLIYLEVFQSRLQISAEEFQKSNKSIPLNILDSIHKNVDKIILLKEKLGLTKNSKTTQSDAYKALEIIEHKAKLWRENNQATRRRICPYCSKMVLWKIRPEAWESQKHPFFRDRILYNTEVVSLYNRGIKFLEFIETHKDHKFEFSEKKLTCNNCQEGVLLPIVTKESVASIFESSTDYISWLINRWNENKK